MERKKGRADWEAPFLDEFCLKYLPFRFLNSRQRMSLTCRRGEIVASFDQAVETSTRGPKISQGGVLLRDGTDVFLPADWVSDRSIVTYSRNGGTRTWRLPSPLAAATGAVLQELTPEGPAAEQRCNVDDGKVSLAYRKGQAFLLTAAG
jgi:hypothetical protein